MSTNTFVSRYEPYLYAVLRVVAGLLFLWHGSQKLFDIPHSSHKPVLYITVIAGVIEFFGGLFVMVGLRTRWVAFVCSGEMAYAYWYAHGTNAILPLLNHGELAMLYCFLFLFIFVRGSGVVSIDNFLISRKQKRNQRIS